MGIKITEPICNACNAMINNPSLCQICHRHYHNSTYCQAIHQKSCHFLGSKMKFPDFPERIDRKKRFFSK